MKRDELFCMFRYPAMIKSGAFCAACFAFLSVVLKTGIVLIPEVSEVRVCNMLACSFGIWFGPAGAWGCAVGNLIGDLGGSLTVLSVPGFLANFFSAWLPYKIWCVWGSALGEEPLARPSLRTRHWLARYALGGFCSVVSCSALLAVTFDLSGDMAAANTFEMIFLNNAGATLLGVLLFILLCRLPEKLLPYWRGQMTEERGYAFPAAHRRKTAWVIILSAALVLLLLAYLLRSGLGLRVQDRCAQPLPLALCIGYTVLQTVLTASCRWENDQATKKC